MARRFPSSSNRTIRTIYEYERFYHTKAYLRSLSITGDDKGNVTERDINVIGSMMAGSGCRTFSEFLERKKEWDGLRRKIPLSFLRHIGCDMEVLHFTLDLDRREYEDALKLPFKPRYAFFLLIDSVFIREPLPKNISEEKAIEYCVYNTGDNHLYCCINYPQIKTIFIEPDGRAVTAYYPPEIEFTSKFAIPLADGRSVCGSSIS